MILVEMSHLKAGKIHILVDSRESSVSFARQIFNENSCLPIGEIEHVHADGFATRMQRVIEKCSENCEILISVFYLSIEQLAQLESLLKNKKCAGIKMRLAAYECFSHIPDWCERVGVSFLPNEYRQRENPQKCLENSKTVDRLQRDNGGADNVMRDRIWVQYRLMMAIISRTEMLGDVCRQIITSQAAIGDSLVAEYNRAMRYFQLGEPDMAGGSYSCESGTPMNAIDELRLRVNKIAATDFNVLIRGESGSGKEAVAWGIHELSTRRDKPFLALNCAGLPDELLESEMFGYKKGSHNQAADGALGLLETVSGGTLFLDELPEMSLRIQAKLLRFMENGEFRPLGGVENKYANVRIIAAGQPRRLDTPDGVRADLKSRISQLDVDIAPLRDVEKQSPGTVYKIAFILLERYNWLRVFNDNTMCELTPSDIKKFQEKLFEKANSIRLSQFPWQESNVRELNNFLRRWIVFGDTEFDRLGDGVAEQQFLSADDQMRIYDENLKVYLREPKTRLEFKELLAKKPFHNVKESYVRHLYQIYSRIIAEENESSDMPKKVTQKELAKLMGVTENTISRYLN